MNSGNMASNGFASVGCTLNQYLFYKNHVIEYDCNLIEVTEEAYLKAKELKIKVLKKNKKFFIKRDWGGMSFPIAMGTYGLYSSLSDSLYEDNISV